MPSAHQELDSLVKSATAESAATPQGDLTEAYLRFYREAVGPDFPILIKLSGADHIRGGLTPTEVAQIACSMEAEGVDGFEVSGGTVESGFHNATPWFT